MRRRSRKATLAASVALLVVEPGRIDVYAGTSSKATLTQPLTVGGR